MKLDETRQNINIFRIFVVEFFNSAILDLSKSVKTSVKIYQINNLIMRGDLV